MEPLDYPQLYKEFLGLAEEMLANASDKGLLAALLATTMEDPDAIRLRSDTDLAIICQLAALGVTLLGKRRAELKELEA